MSDYVSNPETFVGPPAPTKAPPTTSPSGSPETLFAELESDITKSFGAAGTSGLGLFKTGIGVNFTISEHGEPMVEMLPKGVRELRIQGQTVDGFETLRSFLQKKPQ